VGREGKADPASDRSIRVTVELLPWFEFSSTQILRGPGGSSLPEPAPEPGFLVLQCARVRTQMPGGVVSAPERYLALRSFVFSFLERKKSPGVLRPPGPFWRVLSRKGTAPIAGENLSPNSGCSSRICDSSVRFKQDSIYTRAR
jgi:hypothetical protein